MAKKRDLTEQLRRVVQQSKEPRARIAKAAGWDGGGLFRFEHDALPTNGRRCGGRMGITLWTAERLALALGYEFVLRRRATRKA